MQVILEEKANHITQAYVKPVLPPDTKKVWEPVLAGPEEWPVVKLAKNRKAFIDKVQDTSSSLIKDLTVDGEGLMDELELTMFKERLRIQQNPWLVDPDDEMPFWNGIRRELINLSREEEKTREAKLNGLLDRITDRYTNEIAGNFKPSSFRFARAVANFGFSRLLNASRLGFTSIFKNELTLQDKIHIVGETEQLRELSKKGTIIMVPTHFSNLDSILIGWVINTLGLPPFIYGAGLNLFNISLFAYFMNSLGAYKVDRRKKNRIYIETLKTYSRMAIAEGCHSLFFPGGTRSRSGRLESNLKLGLLGSAIEAQREIYQQGKDQKIFIFPVVLNYHFVLEGPSLIQEHLKREGQERYYVEKDEFSGSYKILSFLLKFFTKGSDISVSIGKGMDVLGNYVDAEGHSIDKRGRMIHTREYFESRGEIIEDTQREKEYTEHLGKVIVKEYHRINRVFSSHLVAFTAFRIIRKKYQKLDFYSFLRLPVEELLIPYEEFREAAFKIRDGLYQLYEEGKVQLAPHMVDSLDSIIEHGLANVGLYHAKRPLLKNEKGDLITQNLSLLYYYHNRLHGYGLEKIL